MDYDVMIGIKHEYQLGAERVSARRNVQKPAFVPMGLWFWTF